MFDFKNKKVVITGGCGFIGSHLLRRLLSLEVKEVVVIDSMQFGHDRGVEYNDPRVTIVKHNIGTDPIEVISQYFKNTDILYHLAAQKHNQSLADKGAVYRENIFGTNQVFELAGEYCITDVVFSSSLYAHGSYLSSEMKEFDVPEPRTAYGISKLAGEHLLKMYGEKYNFHHTSLRFFFVYGPRQFPGMGYKSVIVKNFQNLINKEQPVIFGDGEQRLDYVYVGDVVESLILSVKKRSNEKIIHIGSGHSISILELTDQMSKIAKYAGQYNFTNSDWTTGTVRGTNTQLAKNAIGWEARTPLSQGLLETFEWIKGYEK